MARALNEAAAKYLVVGGIAVISHGHERFTKDLDLVVGLESGNLRQALRALEKLGYRPQLPVNIDDLSDPEIRRSWIEDKGMVVLQLWSDRHRRLPIDIFVSEPFDFDSAFEDARREFLAGDLSLAVLDLDRLMEMKERTGRGQDLSDLEKLREIARIRSRNE